MTDDNDRGKMLLEKDKLRIDWPGAGQLPVYDQVSERLLQATEVLDGVYTRSPAWTPLFHKELVTVHPLGGCIMADNAGLGVVNHKGQVFTGAEDGGVYEGLYVSDGAIVPRPLCINPSLTISALAERNCIYMVKDRGWA
jgi:cholesterol oxidase